MNFISRFWHKVVGQKSTVIRALTDVASKLVSSHQETMAHLNNAFHPASEVELEAVRLKVAADFGLRSGSDILKEWRYTEKICVERSTASLMFMIRCSFSM
jgi:hypothetical protein